MEKAVNMLMAETYTDDDLLQPVHEIPMEWIDTAVKKWCAQKRQEVLKTGSRALNCFYKRASVSAFRMTALIYHLWGEDNDKDATDNIQKRCIRFYRYMAQFILDGLLAKWGRQYEVLHKGDVQDDGNRPSSTSSPTASAATSCANSSSSSTSRHPTASSSQNGKR